MLTITVPGVESFDEENEKFVYSEPTVLRLEHSLVSLSKWESIWKKPFLSKNEPTDEEVLDYVRCMTLSEGIDPEVYGRLSAENSRQISDYINDARTATWFHESSQGKGNTETITSELIYYWMVALTIPFEAQHWHLNRLLTLIRICNVKNSPPKKRSAKDIMEERRKLNAERRAKAGTAG